MIEKNKEVKIIFALIILFMAGLLIYPSVRVFVKSLFYKGSFGLEAYKSIFASKGFLQGFLNSLLVSGISALISTAVAFILAYTLNFCKCPRAFKAIVKTATLLPMFLPTITYGFAIIYCFGKQGFFTRLTGFRLFDIYGLKGLVLGYFIYTLPIAFLLINNTVNYLDKSYITVSKLMGDKWYSTLWISILRPLGGTFICAFIQCFFLCFTDFGIPASLGGGFQVIASLLYEEMLGAVPDFNRGAVIAVVMLLPSVLSISLLRIMEKYNISYNKISPYEIRGHYLRDWTLNILSLFIALVIFAVFSVIIIVPLIKGWPYDMTPTIKNITATLGDRALIKVYINTLITAFLTALLGSAIVYGAGLITARSSISHRCKNALETLSVITNTIPGMVLGIAYLLAFKGSSLHNSLAIIILCNIVHFFSTPYLMIKNSLAKMNKGWEITARLMGDSWLNTVVRIVTPNAMATLIEVFSYFFVNATVTVSAVIFIAGAKTMVITTKIKELQHFAKFNEIFVLSILILITNLSAKLIFNYLANKRRKKNEA